MIFKELLSLLVLFSCVCYIFECTVVTTKLSKIVKTRYGQMRGALVEFPGTRLKPVDAFLSLEYGTTMTHKPVRFMPPQSPAERWIESIRVVYTHRSVCPQNLIDEEELLKVKPVGEVERMKRLSSFVMSQYEECMRLNVYVPTE